ncbi:MAG: phenylalanine--tRNA ligase subunit alpha [Planctomycetota bacterium]|nr:MAG: phenylalanine--tRNA ligase subunit alpha [Planctomycetota bacterium]
MIEAPLSPNEEALLRAAPEDAEFEVHELLAAAGLRAAQAQSAAEALAARGLAERTERVASRTLHITEFGRELLRGGGTPEERIGRKLEGGPLPVQEAQAIEGLDKRIVGSAFGRLKKSGALRVAGGRVELAPESPAWRVQRARTLCLRLLERRGEDGLPWPPPGVEGAEEPSPAVSQFYATLEAEAVEALREHREEIEADLPAKRGKKQPSLLELREELRRSYRLTPAGRERKERLGASRPQVAQLTSDMLKDGSWREVEFRRFNIAAPPHVPVGRRNPYRAYLDLVKTKLLSMGFEEMTGSLVQQEFWNMDALFLPQFHPAREIHDVYFVEDPERGGIASAERIEDDALEPVALEHEGKGRSGSRGWSYAFDRERTRRLVLRSQGTVLSARWLRKAKVPGKYFAMARCFRYDTVDATHAPDFFQVEGIVTSEQTSFRHLLGLLRVFAHELARSEEVKFVPGYFPFTEPSVEVHMKHPDLGWVELGGAGIFRPEVTAPHGIETPVIAWGLGLDRMAMVALGIKDIRHLFTNNLPHGLRDLRGLVAR